MAQDKNKNAKLFFGIVAAGFLGYWIAKHYRKGSIEIGPLTGEFVETGPHSDSVNNQPVVTNATTTGGAARLINSVGPFPVLYNQIGTSAIINGVRNGFPQTS